MLMPTTEARGLLTADEFAGVTATVMDNNPGMSQFDAERIVSDALAFVATAAANPGAPIAPSRVVDEGWHALVLHTALYAKLCAKLGAFVHHYPERPDPTRQKPGIIDYTVRIMRNYGYEPDSDLWTTPLKGTITVAADCGHAPTCGPVEPIPNPRPKALPTLGGVAALPA